MSAITISVTIDDAQVDRLAAAIADRVAARVAAMATTAAAPSTPVADLGAHREERTHAHAAQGARRGRDDAALTPRQLETLETWRNRRALEDALAAIVGDAAAELAALTKAEASSVLDLLTAPSARRAGMGGRR